MLKDHFVRAQRNSTWSRIELTRLVLSKRNIRDMCNWKKICTWSKGKKKHTITEESSSSLEYDIKLFLVMWIVSICNSIGEGKITSSCCKSLHKSLWRWWWRGGIHRTELYTSWKDERWNETSKWNFHKQTCFRSWDALSLFVGNAVLESVWCGHLPNSPSPILSHFVTHNNKLAHIKAVIPSNRLIDMSNTFSHNFNGSSILFVVNNFPELFFSSSAIVKNIKISRFLKLI